MKCFFLLWACWTAESWLKLQNEMKEISSGLSRAQRKHAWLEWFTHLSLRLDLHACVWSNVHLHTPAGSKEHLQTIRRDAKLRHGRGRRRGASLQSWFHSGPWVWSRAATRYSSCWRSVMGLQKPLEKRLCNFLLVRLINNMRLDTSFHLWSSQLYVYIF